MKIIKQILATNILFLLLLTTSCGKLSSLLGTQDTENHKSNLEEIAQNLSQAQTLFNANTSSSQQAKSLTAKAFGEETTNIERVDYPSNKGWSVKQNIRQIFGSECQYTAGFRSLDKDGNVLLSNSEMPTCLEAMEEIDYNNGNLIHLDGKKMSADNKTEKRIKSLIRFSVSIG